MAGVVCLVGILLDGYGSCECHSCACVSGGGGVDGVTACPSAVYLSSPLRCLTETFQAYV